MYRLNLKQRQVQAERLRNLDLRLVIGFLKASQRFILDFPNGPMPIVVEGYRPDAVQASYYAQGRTTPGPIITNKKPGQSKHNLSPSLALDIGFLDDNGELNYDVVHFRQFYQYWLEHTSSFRWGGLWKVPVDLPHFEVEVAAAA